MNLRRPLPPAPAKRAPGRRSPWLATLATIALGCGGASPRPALHSRSPAGTGEAGAGATLKMPSFDGLFAPGARWRFAVELDDGPLGALECGVTATRRFPGGRASEVECSEGHWEIVERVAGVWIQTDEGLWRSLELPADGALPDLADASRLLPPRLVAGPDATFVADPPDPPAQGDVSTELRVDGDAWCVAVAFGGGDTWWSELCLDERGPSTGHFGWGSEETHELRFERADDEP